MESIRKKLYITFFLIMTAGAFGMGEYAEAFRSLPTFYGFDTYSFLLGLVYLIVSITLLEFFVMMRIQYVKKQLSAIKENGYHVKKDILDLSRKDEIGELVSGINDVLHKMETTIQKLKMKNKLYSSLTEESSIYVYRFNVDNKITFINKAYSDVLGIKYKEAIGKDLEDYIPNLNELNSKLPCLNPNHPSISISIDMPKIVNQPVPKWIAWSATALFNEQAQAIEYQIVGVNMHYNAADSDVKKEAEGDVFVVDNYGKVSYVSDIDAFSNAVGESFVTLINKEDVFKYVNSHEYVLKTKRSDIINIRMIKDGCYRATQILIEASTDKDNVVKSISIRATDITDIEGAQAEVVGAVNNMNRLLKEVK